MKNLLSLDVTL